MGTSREKLCEFCSQALPDWRDSISSAQYMQIVLKRFWEQTLYFLVPFFLLLLVCTLGLFLYYLGRETFSPSASCQPKGKNCTSVFLFFMFGLVLGIVVGVLGLSTLIIIRMVRRMRAARNGVQPADPVQEPPEPIEIADPPADPVQEPPQPIEIADPRADPFQETPQPAEIEDPPATAAAVDQIPNPPPRASVEATSPPAAGPPQLPELGDPPATAVDRDALQPAPTLTLRPALQSLIAVGQ